MSRLDSDAATISQNSRMIASGVPARASTSSSSCSRSAPATATRCLPVRLASSSARSARSSSSSADSGSPHCATPIEQRMVALAAIRSATMRPPAVSALGSSTTNSSPP